VFGDIDGGARVGGFRLTAGVRGGIMDEDSFSPRRNGDDEGGANNARGPLVGLSYEEPRSRAISSSARPRLILGPSASEGRRRCGLSAEESKDEK
jgi:hypothetical protein